jgi:uncharacterized hydrophobic protein (TIGR00341 family)
VALRLVEVAFPPERAQEITQLIATEGLDRWETTRGKRTVVKVLVQAEEAEHILARLQPMDGLPGFRVVLLPVEATLPRPQEPDEPPVVVPVTKPAFLPMGISREELYEDVQGGAKGGRIFLALVGLSALVAALGMLRNSPAVVIGAMVIAPLLGPIVALSLASTLGDVPLARRALRTGLTGLVFALVIGFALGLTLPVDGSIPELASRTEVGMADLVLALAAGVAGTLATTTAAPAALIGFMVAVALMPPLVASALFLGAGLWEEAGQAGLLVLVNLTALQLAGVSTYLLQGVRPNRWWEADRAKRASRRAVLAWGILLALLAAALAYTEFRPARL